ncbi:helix-turn-helix transcriptional regulator [Agrobacterium rhizogenes]|uniref:helix-turn-helix domain-containing protein n=1 Tax=Rhizobium rhizogenes TaxID=359 RepID=UPI00123A9D14|nr:helix-turn-helix transcriptional regulator [Rhizobium rhizogenes]KAA6489686.1 XRE family transcriptional regulator [Agrobacterium sp. ICMP 7243]NTF48572.1 helix-turn-helix transcriptional regulator [Rhizobium rhizogenes]NTG27506.1 helix-turn-helix transcriptional regulator [Rhizobium rhizogenes]NTH05957.1 helix-turn-helix transcriptional regulator [Rhizobium rhizogenes]NTH25305.1 helix-turn-helix transcriptional regulator [Rhizobium rhizogenes]
MLKTEQETTVFSDESDDTLGGRISMARDAAGISLESLAAQLGVNQETMLAWESDRSEPKSAVLATMAGLFGVSPAWLMTGTGDGPREDSEERALEAVRSELSRLRSAHQDIGRLIETTTRQIERLDHQIRLRNVSKDVAH